MVTKCPVCRSSKITTNEKGEISCKNCNYLWKPSKINTTEKEVKKDDRINNITKWSTRRTRS